MLHEAGRHRLLRYRADQRLQLRRRYLNHFPRQCRVQRLGAPRCAWGTGGLLGRGLRHRGRRFRLRARWLVEQHPLLVVACHPLRLPVPQHPLQLLYLQLEHADLRRKLLVLPPQTRRLI